MQSIQGLHTRRPNLAAAAILPAPARVVPVLLQGKWHCAKYPGLGLSSACSVHASRPQCESIGAGGTWRTSMKDRLATAHATSHSCTGTQLEVAPRSAEETAKRRRRFAGAGAAAASRVQHAARRRLNDEAQSCPLVAPHAVKSNNILSRVILSPRQGPGSRGPGCALATLHRATPTLLLPTR